MTGSGSRIDLQNRKYRVACDHKRLVMKLAPLHGETEYSYLVTLERKKPVSIFGWPLYMIRKNMFSHVKIAQSEVESITWSKSGSSWNVNLGERGIISALENVDSFKEMKNEFFNSRM